ncbi:MAG: hypothetical protein RSC76_01600 [Oscillospiraceae bacterium]
MANTGKGYGVYDGNAARQLAQPKREIVRGNPNNIIRLSETALRHARRKNINPLKVAATIACVTLIFSLVAYMVYGQVRLTELTENINVTTTSLSQLESVEIQLQMQATSNMNVSEMEAYAKNELGMEKINNGQITYVNLATADKGTVIVEDSKNIFEKIAGLFGF